MQMGAGCCSSCTVAEDPSHQSDGKEDSQSCAYLGAQVFGGLPAATTTAEQVKRLAELSEAAADGHQSPAYVALPAAPANGAAAAASTSAPAAANGTAAASPAANGAAAAAATTLLKQRHAVRPPVVHNLGYGPLPDGFTPAPVNVFRHPLLQVRYR